MAGSVDQNRSHEALAPSTKSTAAEAPITESRPGENQEGRVAARWAGLPPRRTGTREIKITGNPEPDHISTSYIERQNLTMRMQMRRFTRLTNAFSRKVENHAHSVALFYMWYNFARLHQTLRVTPAMEAGVSDNLWSIAEIIGLADPLALAA